MTKIAKRSLTIARHQTSISLEQSFWNWVQVLAFERDCSVAALIAEIDSTRNGQNLSSAVRLYVLNTLEERLKSLEERLKS